MFVKCGMLVLAALQVGAQQSYEDSPSTLDFEYHGCAVVDLSGFSEPIVLSGESLTHEQCQDACEGQQIAALFPESCRCGTDANAFVPLDDSICDYPCMGDPSYGMCGSSCPDSEPGTSIIYINTNVPPDDGDHFPPAEAEISYVTVIEPPDVLTTSVGTVASAPSTVEDPPELSTLSQSDITLELTETHASTITHSESEVVTRTFDGESTLFTTGNSKIPSSTDITPTPSDVIWRDDDPPSPVPVPESSGPYSGPGVFFALGGVAIVIIFSA